MKPGGIIAHQEEHARLHDFPGQLHQSALLQKHLENQPATFIKHVGNFFLSTGVRMQTHPPRLNDLMLPVEAVLDLHQLLEVIL